MICRSQRRQKPSRFRPPLFKLETVQVYIDFEELRGLTFISPNVRGGMLITKGHEVHSIHLTKRPAYVISFKYATRPNAWLTEARELTSLTLKV